jgi:hypothetical protein
MHQIHDGATAPSKHTRRMSNVRSTFLAHASGYLALQGNPQREQGNISSTDASDLWRCNSAVQADPAA